MRTVAQDIAREHALRRLREAAGTTTEGTPRSGPQEGAWQTPVLLNGWENAPREVTGTMPGYDISIPTPRTLLLYRHDAALLPLHAPLCWLVLLREARPTARICAHWLMLLVTLKAREEAEVRWGSVPAMRGFR